MGLIRKIASASTLGGVKYTSKREALTKAASAQARQAKAETRLLEEQARTERAARQSASAAPVTPAAPARTVEEIRAAGKAQREQIRVAAAERREERLTRQEEDRPDAWYKEPTIGGLLSRRKAKDGDLNGESN